MKHTKVTHHKPKKFKLDKQSVWRVVVVVSSILLILSSLAPLFLR